MVVRLRKIPRQLEGKEWHAGKIGKEKCKFLVEKGGRIGSPRAPMEGSCYFRVHRRLRRLWARSAGEGSSGEDTVQKVTEGFPAETKIPKSLNTKQVDSFLFNS